MMRQTLYIIILYAILAVIVGCTTESDRMRMRAGLDSINIRNRSGQPFTVADVQPYVTFFDEHGTPNDRLLAHYLLGLAYSDHGEAPMALQCYQKAAECADTTAADCDYAQLARVYGQMAEVFYYQGLYQEQLQNTKVSVKYAWKGKDTLLALRNNEQEGYAYLELRDTMSAIAIFEHVSNQFMVFRHIQKAAITLGGAVRPLIDVGDYDKAKDYINMYDSLSGRFDSCGNIESGREIYYNLKGHYFLHVNQLDSAEYYFRKELYNGKDFNNQHAAAGGLSKLYQRLHLSDSVAKYSLYAYTMLDSIYAQKTTKEVERLQAMYDYTRHQEIARQESERAADEMSKRKFSIAMLLLVAIIASLVIYKMYAEKKKKQAEYIRNLEQLEQTQSEVLQLRAHAEEYEELIAAKEKFLEEQNRKLQEQRKKVLIDHASIDKYIMEADTYKMLLDRQYGQKLSVEELRASRKLVLENLPEFNSLLLSKEYKISEKDFYICVLFRLGFKSKEVSNMLGLTQGRVSQICTKLLHDIFKKDEGGAAELIEILHELY